MKIVYIAGWPIPSRAANAVHVMKMCQAFAHNDQNVSLICPEGTADDLDKVDNLFEHYGVEKIFDVTTLPKGKGRLGLFLYGLKAALKGKSFEPDYVHSRCLMSAWIATILSLDVIFEKHDSLDNQGVMARWIFRSLLKRPTFKGLVVISDALKDHLSEAHNIPKNRILVAHDGADAFPEVPLVNPPFDTGTGRKNIGYIGHLYPGRGIDVIAEIASIMPEADFHIVGGTMDDLAHWGAQLKHLENMHFYGYVAHKDTIPFIKGFDILLAPYQEKVGGYANKGNTVKWMSPLKIFEYMSSGIPMICSDLPVLHEILKHEKNVFLCPPSDPKIWSQTISNIFVNPNHANEIAANAKDEFLEKYTWHKRAEYILKFMRSVS